MIRTAVGTLLVLVVLIAGVGPAAATGTVGPAHAVDPAAGPTPALGTASAQVTGENCSFPVTATDATGTEVTVESEPESVVALGASTAQIMWEVGAREKVVAMPQGSTTAYLNGSQNRTGVFQADGFTVATERVVGTNPDLVVAANVIPNETIETLRGAGLTVFKSAEATSIEDVYDDVNRTGELVGACEGAAESVADTRERVEEIRAAVNGTDQPRVLYPQAGGFAVGNNTFINDAIETAGGDNIAANAGIEGYKQISNETIAERNPQWIVTSSPATIPSGEPYASTVAVQRNQTVAVNGNLISQPGPRIVTPLTEIARTLHPEAMGQANLTNATVRPPMAADGGTNTTGTTTGDTTATATGADSTTVAGTATTGDPDTTGETTTAASAPAGESTTASTDRSGTATGQAGNASTETTSSNGPGFGVVGAAIALLGAALLARRR